MKKKVYSIWCEWDVGQEDTVFTSKAKARKWCEENVTLMEAVADEDPPTLDGLIDNGLLSFREVDVDPE